MQGCSTASSWSAAVELMNGIAGLLNLLTICGWTGIIIIARQART